MTAAAPAASVQSTPELFLIDGSSFLFRAYHQAKNQDARYNARTSDGLPTGAVRLFLTKMMQIVEKGAAGVMPTHVVIAFDKSRAGWRRDLYPDYKGNREAPPEDLIPQMPYMRHAVAEMGLRCIEIDRYEADDIIATYARVGRASGMNVTIVSADKDLMQLVDDGVRFYDFQSGTPGKSGYRPERNYDVEGVREQWEGLNPGQIVDAQALIGDSSDNIPGVKGIGLKTAAELIIGFGSVEAMLAGVQDIKQPKRRESIAAAAEQIRMSKRLATLDAQAPVPDDLGVYDITSYDPHRLASFVKAMEFPAILKRLCKDHALDPNLVEPTPQFAAAGGAGNQVPIDRSSYSITFETSKIEEWQDLARRSGVAALAPIVEDGVLVGFGLAVSPGRATYVPIAHEETGTLFGGRFPDQADPERAHRLFADLLEGQEVRTIGFGVKDQRHALAGLGIVPRHEDDVMLMGYALDNGVVRPDVEAMALRHLRHQPLSLDPILGTGKARVSAAGLEPKALALYAAERADILVRLHALLSKRLEGDAAGQVYGDLELPMVGVLTAMETLGVKVDIPVLKELSHEYGQRMSALEEQIHDLAGIRFQVSSAKQVGDVLFGRLGLPGAGRTTTGQWQTRASILDELAEAGHQIAQSILDWRQIAKLKSTYADALILRADPKTHRVSTTFSLAATNTARLASSDPNLQNIPIRTDEGRRIRRAFIAEPGNEIVSADYSQIELRVLAEMADVAQLKQAFRDGIDIHAMTGSEVFGVPLDAMTPDVRRSAKAINFGIVYGISAFGLARGLGIPVGEAGDYIKRYFERFPGIREYMDATRERLERDGYVTNLFGRRIHFPQYRAASGAERSNIERAAINAPIQSSAADIIRRAMIRMDDAQADHGAQMLLQVHDELVFETPKADTETALPVIAKVMEDACAPDLSVDVPFKVDIKAAQDWDSAH